MPRRILFDDAARAALARGVDRLAGAVAVTLGPRGRNVVLSRRDGSIAITNDGVTVAREVELADRFENLGVRLVREAAQKTGDDVGDGTTTSTVLAHALFRRGLAALSAGAAPNALRRGIDRAVAVAIEALRAQARPLEGETDRAAVAAIAAGGDAAIGRLVAEAWGRVGPAGHVLVAEGRGLESRLDVVDGVRFERGWTSAYFVNEPESMRVVLDSPLVLLHRGELQDARALVPAVEHAVSARRPLLVVAESIGGEALALLVVNQLRGIVRACAVPAPESGDRRDAWLADLAALSGARVVGDEAGLEARTLPDDALGTLRRAVVERGATTLLEAPGRRANVLDHVAGLRRAAATAYARHDREQLERRIARLDGGLAAIEIGAPSELELGEKKGRAEDAVSALKAALAEGIVPGGGTALVRAAAAVEAGPVVTLEGDARTGARVVARALVEPARRIAENAGAPGAYIVAQVREASGPIGFDAELDRFADLFRAGVVDPLQVVRVGLLHAASIAGLLLTADALVVDDERPEGGAGTP